MTLSKKDVDMLSYRLGDREEAVQLNNVKEASELMALKMKDYVTNKFMNKVLTTPNLDVMQVANDYTTIYGPQIQKVLGQVPDFPMIARDVARGDAKIAEALQQATHERMKLGIDGYGNFDVDKYVNGTLLKHNKETDKFVRLLGDKEAMAKLGTSADEIRDTFASSILSKYMSKDRNGFIENSDLYKVINDNRDNMVKVLGEDRVAHMESFQNGFEMTTAFPRQALRDDVPDLERRMFGGFLRFIPTAVSQQVAVARNFVSRRHVMLLNATRVLGGMKSSAYKDYVSRMMQDPKFFQEQIDMVRDAKTPDDIIRLRLFLLHHYGIDTSIISEQDSAEAQDNFVKASETVETSPWVDLGFPTEEELAGVFDEDNTNNETTETKDDE